MDRVKNLTETLVKINSPEDSFNQFKKKIQIPVEYNQIASNASISVYSLRI